MASEILMPALSPTMEEGTLAKWLVAEGDSVSAGQVIAEIETDKATMEYEAADDGIVGRLLVAEGTAGIKVNTPIAVLVDEGEAVPDAGAKAPAPAPAPAPAASGPEATQPAGGAQAPAPAPAPQAAGSAPAPAAAPVAAGARGRRIFASPLARRLAEKRGIDLAGLKGSGPQGRIVRADVEAAGTAPAATPAPAPAPAAPPAGADAASVMALYAGRAFTEVPLDGMRRVIAQRLGEAKRTIPHFYLHRDVRIDALLALRAALNHALKGRGIRLSVNDFIIRACALALQAVPDANAVWAGDRILKLGPSDVAVAVAVEGGLFTPVLRDAEAKTLARLSAEMKDLATRAKSKRLAPHEYQGGSFAISNLGMFGIDSFEAVINPPHGAILAVGAGVRRAVVQEDGTIGVATVMSLSLSADHRVIDGALGSQLLKAIVESLENPHSIVV